MRIFLVFFLLAFLSSCATTNKFQIHEVTTVDKYPPISLIVNDGYVYQDTSCYGYSCSTYVDKTHLFALESIREYGLFERVDLNNALADYKIIMKFERNLVGSKSWGFAKMMISAVTLFLAPIPYEYTYDSEFVVIQRDKEIGKYKYSRQSKEISFLFKDVQSDKKHAIKSIISNLIHDLNQDNVIKNVDHSLENQ